MISSPRPLRPGLAGAKAAFRWRPGRTRFVQFTFSKPSALREVDDFYPGLLFWNSFSFRQTFSTCFFVSSRDPELSMM